MHIKYWRENLTEPKLQMLLVRLLNSVIPDSYLVSIPTIFFFTFCFLPDTSYGSMVAFFWVFLIIGGDTRTCIKSLKQFPRFLGFQLGHSGQCNCRSKMYIAHAGRAAA